MRILLVSPHFPPQQSVASLRTHGFARAWSNAGCAVTVLTTAKRIDQRGQPLPVDGLHVEEVEYQGPALFERLRSRYKEESPAAPLAEAPPRRSWFGFLGKVRQWTGIFSSSRMPDLTGSWVRPATAWACNRRRADGWDVVVSSSGPYTAHLVARAIKRAGYADHWVADFRDLWTAHHLYSGLFPFTLIERRLERSCLREADLLVTVTEELADWLRAHSPRPVEVIYNGYDPEAFAALDPQPYFPADGVRRLVYAGTWYPQGQDPSPLLRCLRQLREYRPDLPQRFSLAIAGWNEDSWRAVARRHGVEDLVHHHGLLPRPDALRMQRDAAALLLLDWRNPTEGVMTGKVFEYLKASAPILAIGGTADSTLARLLRTTGRGLHLGTDEPRILRALLDLLDTPSRLKGTRNVHVIAALTRPVQSLRLLEKLREFAGTAARLVA